jgi:hypothetical protein
MGKTVDNERRKLTATFLNNVAAIMVATAVGLPVYSVFSDTISGVIERLGAMSVKDMIDRGVGVGLFLGLGLLLHHAARSVLSRLED